MANNIAIMTGNLSGLEMKQSASGNNYTVGRLAVSMGKDKEASWFNIICFDSLAENIYNTWMKAVVNAGNKSIRATVRGKIEVSKYGDNNEKTSVKIIADDIAITTQYTVVGSLDTVQSDKEIRVETFQPRQEAAPAPVARPMEELTEADAPF